MKRTSTRPSFEWWMHQVDLHLEQFIDLTSDDLPDCNYWSMWDSGMNPSDAALQALEDSGYDA